jgi:hypothetical protein
MDMEREINLVSDDELNAVVGGRINNGIGLRAEPKDTGGVSAGNSLTGKVEAVSLLAIGVEILVFAALW